MLHTGHPNYIHRPWSEERRERASKAAKERWRLKRQAAPSISIQVADERTELRQLRWRLIMWMAEDDRLGVDELCALATLIKFLGRRMRGAAAAGAPTH